MGFDKPENIIFATFAMPGSRWLPASTAAAPGWVLVWPDHPPPTMQGRVSQLGHYAERTIMVYRKAAGQSPCTLPVPDNVARWNNEAKCPESRSRC